LGFVYKGDTVGHIQRQVQSLVGANEWTEAMREQKIAAKLQERRLHQWAREAEAAQQKSQDDASIARYVRTRLDEV